MKKKKKTKKMNKLEYVIYRINYTYQLTMNELIEKSIFISLFTK